MEYCRIIDVSADTYGSLKNICERKPIIIHKVSARMADGLTMYVRYACDGDTEPCVRIGLEEDGVVLIEKREMLTEPCFDFTTEHDGNRYSLIIQKERPRPESI